MANFVKRMNKGTNDRYRALAYLGHFAMAVLTLLRHYVVDIATNQESLKRCFMSCGNCDELEQASQERQHMQL
jgi:hypothetical protein